MNIPPDRRILYFGRDRERFGFLSHFYPAPIDLDGEVWQTVEHHYQAQKSLDPNYLQAIREAATPGTAKRLAAVGDVPSGSLPNYVRAKSWFITNSALPRPDWEEVKLDIMRRADFAKFTQHPDLAALLLATADAELVEDSPTDPFWGIGQMDGA